MTTHVSLFPEYRLGPVPNDGVLDLCQLCYAEEYIYAFLSCHQCRRHAKSTCIFSGPVKVLQFHRESCRYSQSESPRLLFFGSLGKDFNQC
ncbi:hypothetical protein CPB84DRAFT_374790 [Gymnopilus junonius]|uniref:Uncharacterized protein n=1 Tax=Gymnopilus junonius TaxID=109634 RepID=A0A9P5NBZ5_GYMJU|nr:hypothetical protein CPB84DRAFT_374790 [Gymnopilus junonius]